jgi:hypothetical protein
MDNSVREKARIILHKMKIFADEKKIKEDEENRILLEKKIVACVDFTNKAIKNFKKNVENAMINGEDTIFHHKCCLSKNGEGEILYNVKYDDEYDKIMSYVYKINKNFTTYVHRDKIELSDFKQTHDEYIFHDVCGNIFPSRSVTEYSSFYEKLIFKKVEKFPMFRLYGNNKTPRSELWNTVIDFDRNGIIIFNTNF